MDEASSICLWTPVLRRKGQWEPGRITAPTEHLESKPHSLHYHPANPMTSEHINWPLSSVTAGIPLAASPLPLPAARRMMVLKKTSGFFLQFKGIVLGCSCPALCSMSLEHFFLYYHPETSDCTVSLCGPVWALHSSM